MREARPRAVRPLDGAPADRDGAPAVGLEDRGVSYAWVAGTVVRYVWPGGDGPCRMEPADLDALARMARLGRRGGDDAGDARPADADDDRCTAPDPDAAPGLQRDGAVLANVADGHAESGAHAPDAADAVAPDAAPALRRRGKRLRGLVRRPDADAVGHELGGER